MPTTKLPAPSPKQITSFVESALAADIPKDEIDEVLGVWMAGKLESPFPKEKLKENIDKMKAAAKDISKDQKRDEVLCLACLAACCYWWGCDPTCQACCYVSGLC